MGGDAKGSVNLEPLVGGTGQGREVALYGTCDERTDDGRCGNMMPCHLHEVADPVEHPAHYRAPAPGMSPIEIVEAYGLGFHLGNVVKYVLRAERKNGLEDYRKAAWYLRRFIEMEEKKR